MDENMDLDKGETFHSDTGSICWACNHLHRDNPTTCAAFPKGIPLTIVLGAERHTQPREDGSDEGFFFDPVENLESFPSNKS